MLILDKELNERIINFTKYAQFISEKFGVTVVFDGIKAQTNGTTITLPNIAGMSQKEVDFLYCVLLHEVGHIRHTPFTTENFKKIKSDAHFSIVNSIEDARIENLLIKEFDGANDKFEDLYNDFATDKAFWKKIFGFEPTNLDLFNSFTAYVHYYILNIKNKLSFDAVLGEEAYFAVKQFIHENGIDQIISEHSLESWDDVIALSNSLYEIFFKDSLDESEQNNLSEIESTVEETLRTTLQGMESDASKQISDVNETSKKIKDVREELKKLWEEKGLQISELEQALDSIIDKIDNAEDALYYKERLDRGNKKLESVSSRYEKKKEKVKDLQDKIAELEAIESSLNQKQKDRLARNRERLNKLEKETTDFDEKIQGHKSVNDEILQELSSVPEEYRNLSSDEIAKILDEALEPQKESILNKLDELGKDIREKRKELSDLVDQVKKIKSDFSQKLSGELKDLQDKLDASGVPVQILPGFIETPGWSEADSAQKEFDDSASSESGEIVTNGASFSKTGMRDVLTIVEKAKGDLSSIDLAEHFKSKNSVSKLDSYNDISKITNTVSSEGEALSSRRRHIPLTTSFDVVKTKNVSSGQSLTKLRTANAVQFKQLKELFKLKLKFQKKDKFKGSQDEGGLDQRSLWKLATRTDENFYEISVPKFLNSVVASIAIDVSGSMDKDYTGSGEKLKELSLMLSDALTECYIKHEICGYHAPVSHEMRALEKSVSYNRTSNILETVVYRGFNDRGNTGIENIEIQCSDNCDGESLRYISKRLMKERSKRKILFVITDGKPFLSDSDISVLDQDLKETLVLLSKNKIEVFAFGFNPQGKELYGDRFCQVNSYKDVINFLSKKL